MVRKKLFIVLIGESAVGKTTIMKALQQKDHKFKMIQLTTTRAPRVSEEEDRECIAEDEFARLEANHELLPVIGKHGNRYAIRRAMLTQTLEDNKIPIVDYTFEGISDLNEFKSMLFPIYILPPSLTTLQNRLKDLGRDPDGKRFETAKQEIEKMEARGFAPDIIIGGVIKNVNLEQSIKEILERISDVFYGNS